MGVSLGGIGAAIGGISSLAGLFGGNDAPPAPPVYQPQNLSGADAGAFSGTQNLGQYNTAGAALPYANQTFQNLYNNPYAGQYQQGANAAANTGWGVGGTYVGSGMNLMGAGNSMLPYAQSILNTGFDPQHALYDRTFHQQLEQQRAGQSARGIATTPYGAGLENQANSNFDMDWQNNLLNRQNTAAQGAGYLTNSAGNAINLGQNVSTLGLQTLNNAAALPYSTANSIGNNQFGAIGQYGQAGAGAAAIPQQQIQDYLQYLGIGNQAGGVANQQYANQLTANNQRFNQQQTLGRNLGSSLSGLGTWYGNSGFGNGQRALPPVQLGALY